MEQLTQDGLFTGGSIPYGYRLEKRGRINKRNREVCDLTVDDDAAKIVQLIFYKYVHEGYGAQRLCRYLTELGIRKADGRNFPNTTINRIIKNPIYLCRPTPQWRCYIGAYTRTANHRPGYV